MSKALDDAIKRVGDAQGQFQRRYSMRSLEQLDPELAVLVK